MSRPQGSGLFGYSFLQGTFHLYGQAEGVVGRVNSGVSLPGFQLSYLLAVWLGASYLTSLSLHFSLYEMRAYPSLDHDEHKMINHCQAPGTMPVAQWWLEQSYHHYRIGGRACADEGCSPPPPTRLSPVLISWPLLPFSFSQQLSLLMRVPTS